jgi:hypothetical protein
MSAHSRSKRSTASAEVGNFRLSSTAGALSRLLANSQAVHGMPGACPTTSSVATSSSLRRTSSISVSGAAS